MTTDSNTQAPAPLDHTNPNSAFIPTGSLNLRAITTLIAWAEHDEQTLALYRSWGEWEQGSWGTVRSTDAGLARGLARYDITSQQAADALQSELEGGVCQTSYCMAGQAAAQAGYRLLIQPAVVDGGDEVFSSAEHCVKMRRTGEYDERGLPKVTADGSVRTISSVGAEVLGLNGEQADVFFRGDNGIDDLKRLANLFADDAGMEPPYPSESLASDYRSNGDGAYFQG